MPEPWSSPAITDAAVRAGLSRVVGGLHTSSPPVLPMSRTVEMLVHDGFDKTTPPGRTIPGHQPGRQWDRRGRDLGHDRPERRPITQPGVRRGQQLKLFGTAFRGGTDLNRPGGREPAFWTTVHEVGHGIAFANPTVVKGFDAALLADGGGKSANPVTDYGAKPGEGFPEALALFYAAPAILQAARPATAAFMRATF